MRNLPCILALLGGCFSTSDMLAELDRDGDGAYHPAAADIGETGPFDCDDANAEVGPQTAEACNRVDDDCDGDVDEAGAEGEITWYVDGDRDGYGDPDTSRAACVAPELYIATSGDCDDGDDAVHPGVTDVCNDFDDDCDGNTDEDPPSWYPDQDEDGYGDPDQALEVCDAPINYVADGSDCDDDDPDVSPEAGEVCDGIDNDCDGLFDRDDPDNSGDATWYADVDGDGYGDTDIHQTACSQPAGYVRKSGDCADDVSEVHPKATEICEDGTDDDCDGVDIGCGINGEDTLTNASARFRRDGLTFTGLALGDADGDGFADVLLGGVSDADTAGRAYLLHGGPLVTSRGDVDVTTLDAWYAGAAADDFLGLALAAPGDLDGDGYPEVVVGASQFGTAGAGSIFIDYGTATRRSGSVSPASLVQLVGASAGGWAGFSVAAAGDFDGDGFADLLATAPGVGQVYRVPGASTRYTSGASLSAVADMWQGEAVYGAAKAIAGGFDLDGDGLADFGATTETRVYVVRGGGPDGSLEDADGVATTSASSCYDWPGVALGPDIDGDGRDDLVVGLSCAPDYSGTAWIVPGGVSLGTSSAPALLGDVASFVAYGADDNDHCYAVSAPGDVDGDEQADLAVGCRGVGADDGAVYVFSGSAAYGTVSTASAIAVRTGSAGEESGMWMPRSPGDVNGDGYFEILTASGTPTGAAYLLYGGP